MGRPARGLAAVAVVFGVTFAGGVAIGQGGNDSNGRDGSTVPGAPADAPAPVDVDQGDDDLDKAPPSSSRRTRLVESVGADSVQQVSADNGRGGLDPAAGPNQVVAVADAPTQADASVQADAGTLSKTSRLVESVANDGPIDQDVPGPLPDWPDGPDDPPNDSDG